jgi:FixJ family two-component response regulator
MADRVQMQQVLLNLIMNGIHAMSTATHRPRALAIRSALTESAEVLVEVKDSGPGVDPQDLDRIFTPFFTTKAEGMGLGLSISQSILVTDVAAVVFVVDDDPSMRDSLKLLLRSVNLPVQTFASPQEFLAAPRPDAPGCLILDVRMPGVSGLDLQRQLVDAHVDLPIIFITGYADVRMSVRAMKAGAVEFLTKPVSDQELLDAVHQALARSRASREARAEDADLRRRYVSLTPREREVLQLVVSGLLNKQVAGELGVSIVTVKLHRGHIMRKMGAGSLAELVKMMQKLDPMLV